MANVELTTSPTTGGLAQNPDGSLADVPRALASHVYDELMHVVALLHSVCETVPHGNAGDAMDADRMTSRSSRAVTLASIADDKVRAIVRALAPYV